MVTLHEGRDAIVSEIAAVTPMTEAIAAVAIIVLTILGLVNVVPGVMLGVATIVVGAAILLKGAETAGEYSRLLLANPSGTSGVGGGITLDFLAGGAGIVLGILALFANAGALAPVALIVFGGTLLLSGAAMARLPAIDTAMAQDPAARAAAMLARETTAVSVGGQILVGIAAIVLGILALAAIRTEVLTLVGLLAVGGALLVSSASLENAALGFIRHA